MNYTRFSCHIIRCAFIALLFFPSCKQDAVINIPIAGVRLSYTHADSVEAGELATWYSSQPRASDNLISEVLYSLNYLRYVFDDSARYHDSLTVLRARRFLAPWVVSELFIRCDDTTSIALQRGEYNAWNRFESYLRPASYDSVDILGVTRLSFNGFLNPQRLAELYGTLPGIIWAEPNGWAFSDWSTFPIFPRYDGESWSYVFTGGSVRHTWYFKYQNGKPTFVGFRNPGDPEPSWWNEASLNWLNFLSWNGPQ